MLHIFRKYERILFLLITVVIVISFSFFGTYSSLAPGGASDKVAFVAIDGTAVTQREMDQLSLFLATDRIDKQNLGGVWGPNFLNDGVIKQDFLATGLADVLLSEYRSLLRADLTKKHTVEKRFTPYSHPQAPFVSAKSAWNYFAPDVDDALATLQSSSDPLSDEAIRARIELFLAQEAFPSSSLRQVLRYQERQYQWLKPDPALERGDLTLFGYRFVEDWFGPQFSRLIAGFLCNAAAVAEDRGYVVTDDEVLASLLSNAQESFDRYRGSPALGVRDVHEYFSEQLRRMELSKSDAIRSWKKVLLFRRLFHDLGGAALVDSLAYQQFFDVAQEYVEGNLYRLPNKLHISHFEQLQQLEIYLASVSDPKALKESSLDLPTTFLSPEKVMKGAPSLVQKKYLLKTAHVSKKALQSKVPLKEVWEWQTKEVNWQLLQEKFPAIAQLESSTREDRFSALEALDAASRSLADATAREAIVEANSAWISEALSEIPLKSQILSLREGEKVPHFIGVEDGGAFQSLLEKQDEIQVYTADGENYYHIQVIERGTKPEILTFTEAVEMGVLEKKVQEILKAHYVSIRANNKAKFQSATGSWREFDDVRNIVAEDYFAKILKDILQEALKMGIKGISEETATPDLLAPYRLYSHVSKGKNVLRDDPSNDEWQRVEEPPSQNVESLVPQTSLEDQWKLLRTKERIERSDVSADRMGGDELFSLPLHQWSSVIAPLDGDLHFMYIEDKGIDEHRPLIVEKMNEAHKMLSADAQRVLMQSIVREIKAKRALSADPEKMDNEEKIFEKVETEEG